MDADKYNRDMGESIAIILYGLAISGGANVIFHHAAYAADQGAEVTFLTRNGQGAGTASWCPGTDRFSYKNIEDAEEDEYDIVIATEWRSAYDAYRIKGKKYIYFVQSIESRFFRPEMGLMRAIAEKTYELDYYYITEASWIRDYLAINHQKNAALVRNGIDKAVFCPTGSCVAGRGEHPRFLVEGHVDNWLKNVPKTISLLQQADVGEIWLATPSRIKEYPGVDRVFSMVPVSEMAEIYRSCDVLVKLSLVEGMFGPPLEQFHCGGTALVYDVEGHDEYIEKGKNAIVVNRGDEEAVINELRRLKTDVNLRRFLTENALKTASSWLDWKESSSAFYSEIQCAPEISSHDRLTLVKKGRAGADAYRLAQKYIARNNHGL